MIGAGHVDGRDRRGDGVAGEYMVDGDQRRKPGVGGKRQGEARSGLFDGIVATVGQLGRGTATYPMCCCNRPPTISAPGPAAWAKLSNWALAPAMSLLQSSTVFARSVTGDMMCALPNTGSYRKPEIYRRAAGMETPRCSSVVSGVSGYRLQRARTVQSTRRRGALAGLCLPVKRRHVFRALLICRVTTSDGVRPTVVTEPEPNDVPAAEPSVVSDDAPSTVTAGAPWYRRRGILAGLALVLAAAIAALVFTNGRNHDSVPAGPAALEVVPAMPPGQNQTIRQYIKDNQITSTAVHLGDPGAPNIVIALPQGWSDLGTDTPPRAYGAVEFDTATDPNDPPTIVVLLSKLTGDVDPVKILEYAPVS